QHPKIHQKFALLGRKIFCGSDFWHIKAQNAVNPAGFTSILTKRWRKSAPQKTGSDYTRHLKYIKEVQ
ncbi:MAG: hypothetical protein IJO24_00800, partial [Clostridia bacterium]|nr:hypothetical protein [Clostridia bacterium]